MNIKFKISAIVLLGAVLLGGIGSFYVWFNHFITKRQEISSNIMTIEALERQLDGQVLHSAFVFYDNQDSIVQSIKTLQAMTKRLRDNPNFKTDYPESAHALAHYTIIVSAKIDFIYRFQSANSAVKNATSTIPSIKAEALRLFSTQKNNEEAFLQALTQIGGGVFMAKGGLDEVLISTLSKQSLMLPCDTFSTDAKRHLCNTVKNNIRVISEYFPDYVQGIDFLATSGSYEALKSLRTSFAHENKTIMYQTQKYTIGLGFLYLLLLGLIIMMLLRSEKESRTDRLTSLGNRKKYEEAIRSGQFQSLLLINIDRFKNYNDFYGVNIGDTILRSVSDNISKLAAQHSNSITFFRLGADEFGLLFDSPATVQFTPLSQDILQHFETHPLHINDLEIFISITVALSTHTPFLETADMAMKKLKISKNNSFIVYDPRMNLRETIENNLSKLATLKDALDHHHIIPHFQPIVPLSISGTPKYESLARILSPDGAIESIVSYIPLLDDSRLSGILLRQMFEKTFLVMENNIGEFSINLSSSDLDDTSTVNWILQQLEASPKCASRLVFEILESHIIDDYSSIERFIHQVRSYGCKIAIDDFGSGYSNFARLLNLSIDYLKIDASLIRPLATDPNAHAIVATIVAFAHTANIKTIAEFVSSQEIYDAVVALGVDYSQGYYTGKPEALS